jgi:hypothetical protein
MPKPEDWKGSDLRSRADVVRWLRSKGSEIHDPTGLIVGRMREEMGKGRALSQLLADMEADGMIRREVRGRRTLSIKLLDDWGLGSLTDGIVPEPIRESEPTITADVDLELLAQSLLAIVIQRAQAAPTGTELADTKAELKQCRAEIAQLRDDLIMAREAEAEQRRQADTMRETLVRVQAQAEKVKPKTGGTLSERLKPQDRALLKSLQESLPKH